MIGEPDILAFLLCVAAWMTPFFLNVYGGKVRLLHPTFYVPAYMVWLTVPPLLFRVDGGAMFRTAHAFSEDPWFLAAPMLLLAVSGLTYHLGLALSGTSLLCAGIDSRDVQMQFPLKRGIGDIGMFSACLITLIAAATGQYISGGIQDLKGYYWLLALFISVYYLPCIMLAQNMRMGSFFLFICLPVGLLVRSKSAFLMFLVPVIVFFEDKALVASKLLAVGMVVIVLLTPYAVTRYAYWQDPSQAELVSWEEALSQGIGREHSFECFSIIYHATAAVPEEYVGRTVRELLQIIPSFLWPEKPIRMFDLSREYLIDDWIETRPIAFTNHLFSIVYLDCGALGCIAATFLMGYLFGYAYKRARTIMIEKRETLTMLLFLIATTQAPSLITAGPALYGCVMIAVFFNVAVTLGLAALLSARSGGKETPALL